MIISGANSVVARSACRVSKHLIDWLPPA